MDFSPDGETIAVGQTNGEFLLLAASDLSVTAQRRDRNNTIQCIRCKEWIIVIVRDY